MLMTLPFLGNRPYLHSTTLLDALLEAHPLQGSFIFKVEKPIFSDCVSVSTVAGHHSASLASQGVCLYVTECSQSARPHREEFDEEAIAGAVTREEASRFFLKKTGNHSFVALTVAAFKHVLLTHFPVPQVSGHWAFIRADFTGVPKHSFAHIRFGNIYCRGTMAKCEVEQDNMSACTVYFSWIDF